MTMDHPALIPIRKRIRVVNRDRIIYQPKIVNYDPEFMKKTMSKSITKPKHETETVDRDCLKCRKHFKAAGHYQRICESCREANKSISPVAEGVMGL